MKVLYTLICITCFTLLTACGTKEKNNLSEDTVEPNNKTTFQAEVLENETSLLVKPDENSDEFKSSDKIVVHTTDTEIEDKYEKNISLATLTVGDLIEISYGGIIMESYPAQINASHITLLDDNLLISAYEAVIADIYKEDDGLNGDITTMAFDFSQITGLTDHEKDKLMVNLEETYDYKIIEGTYDELVQQGIIDEKNPYFKDGILITIKNPSYDAKKMELSYGIAKWRSGDGAVGADEVTATYDGEQWTIEKKSRWIS